MGYKDYKIPVLKDRYHYVTSDYGLRYIFGSWSGHNGVDIVGKKGADYIISYADGVVTYARDNSPSAGVYVVIHHGDNLYTRYLHMSSRYVNIGDRIKKGQIIGYMGTTGLSTGVHLHFDITINCNKYGQGGNKVDPNPYLFGEIEINNSPTNKPPEIININQISSTEVQIEGRTNEGNSLNAFTICYYKWGKNVSPNDYDGTVKQSGDFKFVIEKPRDAIYISVLPVQVVDGTGELPGNINDATLKNSYPCLYLINNKPVIATPQIYLNGQWKEATPTLRKNRNWYKLYNTDSERVK